MSEYATAAEAVSVSDGVFVSEAEITAGVWERRVDRCHVVESQQGGPEKVSYTQQF